MRNDTVTTVTDGGIRCTHGQVAGQVMLLCNSGTGNMSQIFRVSATGQNYSEFHNVHPLPDKKEFDTIDPIKWNLLTLS